MMERLRNLPTWLRLFLAALPLLMCIPVACIIVFVYQQYTGTQAATATAAAVQTSAALTATQQAADAIQQLTQEAGFLATEFAVQATEAASELEAAAAATAEALALEQQAQTATALAQPVNTDTPAPILPTDTATRAPVFATATPKTITVTLRECRGDEGVLFFGAAQPQSFHAFSSLSFTVPPGTYRIRIDWKSKPENNVNTDFKLDGNQVLTFGDQCQ